MWSLLVTCKLTEIEVSNIVYCMVMAKFSKTKQNKTKQTNKQKHGGPQFHMKMETWGPHLGGSPFSLDTGNPKSAGFQPTWTPAETYEFWCIGTLVNLSTEYLRKSCRTVGWVPCQGSKSQHLRSKYNSTQRRTYPRHGHETTPNLA